MYRRISDNYLVQRIRATDGTWSSESVVNNASSSNSSLVLLSDGGVLCVYKRYSDEYLVQRIRDTNGNWGNEGDFNNASSIDPSLVLLPDGRVLCVYKRYSDGYLVQRIRTTGGVWGSESVVNSADSALPALTILSDGKVLCVYRLNSNGYLRQRIDNSSNADFPYGTFQTPVGAGIVEIGQNTNGVYIKFSKNSLLVCLKTVQVTTAISTAAGSIYYNGSSISAGDWSKGFAALFTSVGILRDASNLTWVAGQASVSTTSAGTFMLASSSSRSSATYKIDYIGIGTWQ